MSPFTSLNAASSKGPGASRDLGEAARTITIMGWTTGAPSACVVHLEGSHDGQHWISLFDLNLGEDGGGSPLIWTVETHFVRHVRANLTNLSGGSSPTVTATLLADLEEEE